MGKTTSPYICTSYSQRNCNFSKPSGEFHADTSFEINCMSCTLNKYNIGNLLTSSTSSIIFPPENGRASRRRRRHSLGILHSSNLSQVTPSNSGCQQVSQYGLYDALSDAYKKFLDGLHAVHTSRLQCLCLPPTNTLIQKRKTHPNAKDKQMTQS